MSFPLSLPQAPVSAGQSGHLNDHNLIQADLSTLEGMAQSSVFNVVAPPYGADPTGVSDSTNAINAAVAACAAAGGGVVYFPAGTYLVTPVSSTSAALVLNNGTTGYYGVRLVGASESATMIKRSAAGPILSMSGPATDTSGTTHCRYSTLESITLHGNGQTGTLVQAYYADDLAFWNVHFTNSNDVVFDTAEFWDSRFYNCLFDSSGSLTADTTAPMVWLRNSAATSGFGYSADTVNNIHFVGCRWEQYKTGAVRIERGLGTNVGQPYSLYWVNSKFETAVINGGSAFFCDTTARDVRITDAHAYAGGFYTGYSTAKDVFTFGPQFGSMEDVLIFNATASACIADGVTVTAPLAGSTVTLKRVRGSYTGGATPTGAHINYGTQTGKVIVEDCNVDNGTVFAGNSPQNLGKDVLGGTPTTIANTTTLTALQDTLIAAGEPFNRTVYSMKGFGTYGVTGTPTMTFGVYWGGVAGTLLCALPAITATSGITGATFEYEVIVSFNTPTAAKALIILHLQTSTSTGATSVFSTSTSSPVTVASSTAKDLVVGFTWGAASASNTISLNGARTLKEV